MAKVNLFYQNSHKSQDLLLIVRLNQLDFDPPQVLFRAWIPLEMTIFKD